MAGITITYHVFADSRDEWLDDYSQALALFRYWASDGNGARLYEEQLDDDGELITEQCLQSRGEYPR